MSRSVNQGRLEYAALGGMFVLLGVVQALLHNWRLAGAAMTVAVLMFVVGHIRKRRRQAAMDKLWAEHDRIEGTEDRAGES